METGEKEGLCEILRPLDGRDGAPGVDLEHDLAVEAVACQCFQ